MKKSLALVLALIMVLSSFSFVSAAPDFSDVAGTKYEDAVTRLELLNVLKGYPDGSFKPEGSITRAEFAAVAVRVKGLAAVAEASKGLPSGFSDVPAGHWAAGYVGVAGSTGIVNGIGGGLFAPNAPVKYEEAITMLVRALGYEQDALSKGGYPYGYLIVAKEIDLLDSVAGVMGMPATRGMVAMLTDNALEIPMMVQVGFGSDAKWVVSGSKEHGDDAIYLLDQMGYSSYEAVVEAIDVSDLEIRVNGDDSAKDGWYNVPADFNFLAAKDAKIKMWADGDDLLVYAMVDKVFFDAVDANTAGDEITLKVAGDKFDVAAGLTATDLAFAKVIVSDSDDEVIKIENMTFDDFILVEEIDDEVIFDLNDDELDVEGFAFLMDGKMVDIDALKANDIVFYINADIFGGEYDGLAVVFNSSKEGVIERLFANSDFRMGGKTYSVLPYAMYLDGDDLGILNGDILEGMMDDESEIEVFFDFNGKAALIVGDTGIASTSSFYAVVTTDSEPWTGRGGVEYWNLDVFTEKGEEVDYDVKTALTTGASFVNDVTGATNWDTDIVPGALVQITVDEDGDITKVVNVNLKSFTKFEIDDRYAEVAGVDTLLQTSTIIFYDYDSVKVEYDKVIKLGDVDKEFFEVLAGKAVAVDGRVKVVLATETDSDTDTTEYTGLVTDVDAIRGGEYEVTIEVAGKEMTFDTDATTFPTGVTATSLTGKVWTLIVGNESLEIEEVKTVTSAGPEKVTAVDISDRMINTKWELTSDAVIYDEDLDQINLRDIVVNADQVLVYFDGNSNYWVKYVLVTDYVAPPVITVNAGADFAIYVGGSHTQAATTVPATGVTLSYASSDTAIATVDATTGMVTGVAEGQVTITVTGTATGYVTGTDTVVVTIVPVPTP